MHFPTDRTDSNPLMDQLWTTGWNRKQSNCKCIRHAGSIHHARGSKPLPLSVLPPELRPALKILIECTNNIQWWEEEPQRTAWLVRCGEGCDEGGCGWRVVVSKSIVTLWSKAELCNVQLEQYRNKLDDYCHVITPTALILRQGCWTFH